MEKILNPTDTPEFAENIQTATETAQGAINQGSEQLQQTVAAVSEAAKAALNNIGEQITVGARATDRYVREKPYQAAAVALGVGLLVGYLIKRK